MIAEYMYNCLCPDNGLVGFWIYRGKNHKEKDSRISPFFSNFNDLVAWIEKSPWSFVYDKDTKVQLRGYEDRSKIPWEDGKEIEIVTTDGAIIRDFMREDIDCFYLENTSKWEIAGWRLTNSKI